MTVFHCVIAFPPLSAGGKAKRLFKKFTYRGVDLDKLLDMSAAEVRAIYSGSCSSCSYGASSDPHSDADRVCLGRARAPLNRNGRTSHLPPDATSPLFLYNPSQVVELLPSRIRRRFASGLTPIHMGLVKRMRKAKKDTAAPGPNQGKPIVVKTHLRDLPILPEMVRVMMAANGTTALS